MSYIVSARKYRPKTFEDVVGQEQITTTLKRSIETNHLAQAFLFCGPRGVGKTTCARIMAKAVNTGKTEKLDEIDEDFSFNIFELDAASNNKVEDMHQLIAQVRIPPQTGKYKIYIIDEVHMLSQAAFNAFLKTLEEPPPYAIFILATTEKHKILPTILSRCQIYDFKRITVLDMVKHLQEIAKNENIQADESALHIIAEKADGALRDALSIFDRLVSFAGNHLTYESAVSSLNVLDYDYFFKITEYLLSADLSNTLLAFDEILNNGFEGDHFVNGLSNHFRNIMVCKDAKTIRLLEVSDDLKKRYFEQASICPLSFLVNALSLAAECDVAYASSINKRLQVETMLMRMTYLSNLLDKQQLFANETVEKKNLSVKTTEVAKESIQEPIAAPKIVEEVKEKVEELPKPSAIETLPPKPNVSVFSSLDALEKEIEISLSKPEVQEEEADQDPLIHKTFLELTEENVKQVWTSFLESLAEKNMRGLLEIINDKDLLFKDDSLFIIADSQVEKTLIEKDGLSITQFLDKHFDLNHSPFEIVVEENEQKQKVILNQKDKYNRMLEKNPLLQKLKENLDLELEL